MKRIYNLIDKQLDYFNKNRLLGYIDYHKFYVIIGLISALHPELKLSDEEFEKRRKLFQAYRKSAWEIALKKFPYQKEWREKTIKHYNDIANPINARLDYYINEDTKNIINPYITIIEEKIRTKQIEVERDDFNETILDMRWT